MFDSKRPVDLPYCAVSNYARLPLTLDALLQAHKLFSYPAGKGPATTGWHLSKLRHFQDWLTSKALPGQRRAQAQ